MSASRLLPVLVIGLAAAGAAYYILGEGPPGDPVVAAPEGPEERPPSQEGPQAAAYVPPAAEQRPTPPDAAEQEPAPPQPATTPKTGSGAVGGSSAAAAPTSPTVDVQPQGTTVPPKEQRHEEAVMRAVTTSVDHWAKELQLDEIAKNQFREAFLANADRSLELRKMMAEGGDAEEIAAVRDENLQAFKDDLRSCLTSAQWSTLEASMFGAVDG